MTKVRLSSAAQQDLRGIQRWYAELSPRLDLHFQRELEEVLRQMEDFPSGYPMVYKDIRKASLSRFRYGVFYHLRGSVLYILAIVHHARHPNVWQKRR